MAESIHKEISSLLINGLRDPRIGFVTITAVDVSPDLRQAKVFYTVMGSETERVKTQSGLVSCTSFIRQQIGRHLRLRYVPDIRFEYDASFDYGQHIEQLLRDVKSDEPQDD